MESYSYKRAGLWGAGGGAFFALAGAFQAAVHYNAHHFETLGASFSYVAQPETIAVALVASAAFGAFMEYKNCYYNARDKEDSEKIGSSKKPLCQKL
ncbi:MAG: hypothetical protein CO093_05600 [Alphaproteobacteria bacterium CG_4_9_14_3_um_filter_47_13]|nr:MAG: hypothetical protein CO093_05600 [Alphaproteobacteria bacterium CG_4_9_14_3_um_filter_47_13]